MCSCFTLRPFSRAASQRAALFILPRQNVGCKMLPEQTAAQFCEFDASCASPRTDLN
jgi:hypothetical protein